MKIHENITVFFEEALADLKCQRDTRTYIIGIFRKYRSAETDLSKYSVSTLFAQARKKKLN